jgi:hypothetical protein
VCAATDLTSIAEQSASAAIRSTSRDADSVLAPRADPSRSGSNRSPDVAKVRICWFMQASVSKFVTDRGKPHGLG